MYISAVSYSTYYNRVRPVADDYRNVDQKQCGIGFESMLQQKQQKRNIEVKKARKVNKV